MLKRNISILLLGLTHIVAFMPFALAQDTFQAPIYADIIQGWDVSDGRRISAVQLTLEPEWKTYWRAPGSSGIPPHFDWSQAENLAQVSIKWPTPKVFFDDGVQSIGYKNKVVIPMYLTPSKIDKPIRLRATMSLGLCSEVCIPYEIKIDTLLNAPDTKPTPAIVAALADGPYTREEAGVQTAICKLRPTENGMEINATIKLPHTGGREIVIIETNTKELWVSEAHTNRKDDTLTAVSEMIHVNKGSFAIDRSSVRITIIGKNYAVDIQGCVAS